MQVSTTPSLMEQFKGWLTRFNMAHGRKFVIALPYIWLVMLFFIPFLIVFKISFSEMVRGVPPYTNLLSWDDGQILISLSLNNYWMILEDSLDFGAYLHSLKIGVLVSLAILCYQQFKRIRAKKKSEPKLKVFLKFLTHTILIFLAIRLTAWADLSSIESQALIISMILAAAILAIACWIIQKKGLYLPTKKQGFWWFIGITVVLFLGGRSFGVIQDVADHGLNNLLDSLFMLFHLIQAPIFNIETDLSDSIYVNGYLESLRVAGISTLLCILVGYPIAWAISRCEPSTRNILLLLIILPSWTSFLIRIYAWTTILRNNGLLNYFLMSIGVIDEPLVIMNTDLAVYIGIVYAYLPFVILPIYNSLTKIDYTLVEAASDLGCKPIKTFFRIMLPLTKNGIIAGGMLVFIPAVGEYVIPELLGGSNSNMIGRVLWEEFFKNRDWPVASAVASVMLIILIVPIFYFNKYQNNNEAGGR